MQKGRRALCAPFCPSAKRSRDLLTVGGTASNLLPDHFLQRALSAFLRASTPLLFPNWGQGVLSAQHLILGTPFSA